MRSSLLTALIPAAVVALAACGGPAPGAGGEGASPVPGHGVAFAKLDLPSAVSRARTEKRLVLVDVYTDWCGWCRKMDHDVFQDDSVGAAAKELVAVRIDAEKDGGEKVAERFAVEGFPTILFLDGEGRLLKRIDGYVGRDEMLAVLRGLPRTRS